MSMTIHSEQLLHSYTKTIERKIYVDAKTLAVFAGHVTRGKSRKLKSAIDTVIDGAELELKECGINEQKTCFVAVGNKQIIIICGLQSGYRWTQLRRKCVSYFFPKTQHLIPDSQLFANPLSISVKQCFEPESGFSQKMHTILATLAATEQERIHAKAQKNSLYPFEA